MRKIIDDNAATTHTFMAHLLPDLAGAVVMPVAILILLFVFDWRLGMVSLIPLALSIYYLKVRQEAVSKIAEQPAILSV